MNLTHLVFVLQQERLTKHLPEQTIFQQSGKMGRSSSQKWLYEEAESESGEGERQPLPLQLAGGSKELQTSTDSGYTHSEGPCTTHSSAEMAAGGAGKRAAQPGHANGKSCLFVCWSVSRALIYALMSHQYISFCH